MSSETARERIEHHRAYASLMVLLNDFRYEPLSARPAYIERIISLVDAAHNADLWERALDPATVEAVAKSAWDTDTTEWTWDRCKADGSGFLTERMETHLRLTEVAITALLTALIGPKPESEANHE